MMDNDTVSSKAPAVMVFRSGYGSDLLPTRIKQQHAEENAWAE